MNPKKIINYIKYNILHLRPPLLENYHDYLKSLDTLLEDYDNGADNPESLGKLAFKQMVELNSTLRMLQKKIKSELPDYLVDNLEEISVGGSVSHVTLKFHFTNYSKMNRKIFNEIRSDFASCVGIEKLPACQMEYNSEDFVLIFYISNYN